MTHLKDYNYFGITNYVSIPQINKLKTELQGDTRITICEKNGKYKIRYQADDHLQSLDYMPSDLFEVDLWNTISEYVSDNQDFTYFQISYNSKLGLWYRIYEMRKDGIIIREEFGMRWGNFPEREKRT